MNLDMFKGMILVLAKIAQDNLIYWMSSEQCDVGHDALDEIIKLCEEE